MNREFYQKKAYGDGVKAAKAARTPLSIWPSERHLVTVHDLPVVDLSRQGTGYAIHLVRTDAELQRTVVEGRRYGLLSLTPNHAGEFAVGEWS